MSRKNGSRPRTNQPVRPDGLQVVGYRGNGLAKTISSRPRNPFAELDERIARNERLPLEIPTRRLWPHQEAMLERIASSSRTAIDYRCHEIGEPTDDPIATGDIVRSYADPHTEIPIFRIGIVVGETGPNESEADVAFPQQDGAHVVVERMRIDDRARSSGPALRIAVRSHDLQHSGGSERKPP